MNERQRFAIENCMDDLNRVLLLNLFLSHLVSQKIFSRSEMECLKIRSKSGQNALILTINILKHKAGGWESLIAFLKDNLFDKLVTQLQLTASTVDKLSNKSYVAIWLNGCDMRYADVNAEYSLNDIDTDTIHSSSTKLSVSEMSVKSVIDIWAAENYIPDLIELMRIHPNSVQIVMSCLMLIDKYSCTELRGKPLRQSLIKILLSAVKLHLGDSLVVEICVNILNKIDIDQEEIDLYTAAIECLLDLVYVKYNLDPTTQQSLLKLLERIAFQSDVNRKNLIGQKMFVEKICQTIRIQLRKPEYDDLMEISWSCLYWICLKSVANQKRFLDAGGFSLFQQCGKIYANKTNLISVMTRLMLHLTKEELVQQDLITKCGAIEFCRQIWIEVKDALISSDFIQIFANFLSRSPLDWPCEHQTNDEVKMKLEN